MAELLIKLMLFCLLPAVFLNTLAARYFGSRFSVELLALFSLGLAPPVTTLAQYYLLILFPRFGDAFYLLVPQLGLIMAAWPLRRNWWKSTKDLGTIFPDWFKRKPINLLFWLLVVAYWLIFVIFNPIAEHDFFEYATQARIFAEEQVIRFEKNRFDNSTGFYYVGLHGYLFLLEGTKEFLFNNLFHFSADYFFRAVTGYYWFLIVFFQYHLFAPLSKRAAVLANLALMLTYGFYLTFITYHIDSYRILLLLFALFWAWHLIKRTDARTLWVCSAIMGLAASAHSLGMMLMCILLGLIFFFLKGSFGTRMNLSISLLLGFLPFGALHYLLDVFYGTGWLFKDIKFF